MVQSEKVSIILPTYNGAKYLRGSIESCLSQTHRDLELILVDDRSTDETPAIMKSFSDSRIKIVRNEVNQRLPKSLNIGFRHATGNYLTWTSDDNEYTPAAIEKMLQALRRNPDAGFVYADYWAFYEDTGTKELVSIPEPLNLAVRNTLGACFLYTRNVYETVGEYNPHYEIVEDYDYWIRVWQRFKMTHVAEPIYLYRYHSKSLTLTRRNDQDLFDAILKYRNGYISASKLGWVAAYYFYNVDKENIPAEKKTELKRKSLEKIKKLSPSFYAQFLVLSGFHIFLKKLKDCFGKR